MKTFLEYLAESVQQYDKWRPLTVAEIKFEYMVEYPKLEPAVGDVFPTEEDFIYAVQGAPIVTLTRQMDQSMEYRSHSSDIQSLKDLVSTYRYPRDVDSIVRGFMTNTPMPTPIVVQYKNTRLRVMGGNTRLDVCEIMGITPKVTLLRI